MKPSQSPFNSPPTSFQFLILRWRSIIVRAKHLNMSFLNLDYLSVGSSSYFYNYPDFTPYANPPTNYLGTVLFLLYILLALVLTGYIPLSLFKRYQSLVNFPLISTTSPPSPRIRDARARHIKIYAGLASVSLAMLSYHMLNLLMENYAHWSASEGSGSEMNVETLKQWMLNSALFEKFAREMVDDGPSTVWMQVGVLGTWFWGVWMGGKGLLLHSHLPCARIQN